VALIERRAISGRQHLPNDATQQVWDLHSSNGTPSH
jgi:hypothetical protein